MPYLPKPERGALSTALVYEAAKRANSSADLTYIFYLIAKKYFEKHKRFFAIADVRGAFESALDEFNRRIAHPYEDEAIKRNGDI